MTPIQTLTTIEAVLEQDVIDLSKIITEVTSSRPGLKVACPCLPLRPSWRRRLVPLLPRRLPSPSTPAPIPQPPPEKPVSAESQPVQAPVVPVKTVFEVLPGRTLPHRPGHKTREKELPVNKAARVRSLIANSKDGWFWHGVRVTHARSHHGILQFKMGGRYVEIQGEKALTLI